MLFIFKTTWFSIDIGTAEQSFTFDSEGLLKTGMEILNDLSKK